jgi:hypothetical protein
MAYTLVTTADTTTADTRYRGLNPSDVAVTNLDNDIPQVNIVQSGSSTTATEGGSGDTYTVILNSQPTDPVTITVTPDAQLNLGVGAGAPIALNFDAGNWNTPQVNERLDDAVVEATTRQPQPQRQQRRSQLWRGRRLLWMAWRAAATVAPRQRH